jgi:predicted metalloendopeptidase
MSRRLFGVEKEPERWRFAVQQVNAYLGDAIGELYVAKHFPPEHKRQVEEMYDNVRRAFSARLDKLDWMDAETRAEAHAKLDALVATIGYPEDPTDYSSLHFERDKLIENLLAAHDFYDRMMRDMLDGPADETVWSAPAQTVNAFYNTLTNSLVLPAGILKPPFFDPKADPAENYGGIGAIIGHEISHGFDDQGRQMDEHGARRNWWTEATNAKFLASSHALVEQYNGYCRSFDMCVDGGATLSENIADLAGLELAYDAYKSSLGGRDSLVIDGKTGEQRFFLTFALQYREKLNDEVTRSEFRGGGHSPAIYRVNGVVRNMGVWYEAFSVQSGSKLYLDPAQRVKIW